MRNTDLHHHENSFEDNCPICMEGQHIKGTKNLVTTNCCGKIIVIYKIVEPLIILKWI